MNFDSDEAMTSRVLDCPERGTLRARLRARARLVRQGWLQVFGIPDYERYLAHRAAHHAGEAVLSRREFFAAAIERKYSRSGPRCC
jgi:uncharacterized short protein YbdD (DUF466 family)